MKRIDETKWGYIIAEIRKGFGDIPIFVFIDWASSSKDPLRIFSQSLTPSEQREFLRVADEFSLEIGINFVYPVHGGFMGYNAKKLSFCKSGIYDSLAREFQTYGTIKELAQKK